MLFSGYMSKLENTQLQKKHLHLEYSEDNTIGFNPVENPTKFVINFRFGFSFRLIFLTPLPLRIGLNILRYNPTKRLTKS